MADELYKDEEWLRERWFSDMPATEIAEEAGCSDRPIHDWARKFGFPPKDEVVTESKPYRDEEWLRERWFSPMRVEEIAAEAGTGRATIHDWAERFGFPNKESARPWFDPDIVEELYWGRDMSLEEVAEELGCSPGAVRGTMDRNGIDRRAAWEHLEKPASFSHHRERGHEQISFTVDGQTRYYDVHRLLAIAEWGLDEVAGKIVHHKNGIPWDNRVENLELIDSQAEHAKMHNEERERDEFGRYV